jgi:uncharacterized protein (DUF488 family)
MPTVCTIGYTKKNLEQFITLLREAGVDAVIDIRLRNTSQLAGYSKRDDLAFLLGDCYGIAYEHRQDLAPSADILDAHKAKPNWTTYERDFRALMAERQAQDIGREILARHQRPCLLCAEPEPSHCHRRLVAEWWAQQIPELEVVHL